MSDLWRDSRRIVIKLGTQVVLEADGQLARKRLTQLINHCAAAWKLDKEILLVSSGAVGLGGKSLKISQSKKKSLNLVEKQACASVGQSLLMDIYRELFSAHGITTAQILVTASDFSDRRRYLILRQTLEKLLSMRVIPIINENDAVSTMELKEGAYSSSFGDNDKLSALVAGKLDADLLVILTNVEGIFSADPERNPEATLISEIDSFEQLASIDSNGTSPQGRGGMSAKIEALRIAFISGVHTMIRSGNNPDTLLWMTNTGVSPEGGTLVKPGVSLPKRRSWIGLASSTFGRVVINSGAVDALVERNASLLPSGVVGVEGSFQAGQVISIEDEQGHNVGRGISRFSARDALKISGLKSDQISNVLGKDARAEVIHRDNLVVFKEHFVGTASGDFKKMNPSQQIEIETVLRKSRKASHEMALLSDSQKRESLDALASLIDQEEEHLLTENQKDLNNYQNKISESLFQRLILNPAKMQQIIQGIRDVRDQPDPVGRILSRRELDKGLILEKQTVPIGVVGIIFESRPDVLPQILSLALKSGNAIVLKGGHEAYHSNLGFMSIVEQLYRKCAWMPAGWATLLDSRADVHKMLNFPQYIDLVIPRGSKNLVRSIMDATSIPVLGHADGICHLYIDAEANLENASSLVVDCKAQYPAACNAIETLLIHRDVAERFMPTLDSAAADAGIHLRGCPETRRFLPNIEAADEKDWHTEYGDRTLSVRIVPDVSEAIIHINHYGSHHTDAILTLNTETQEQFLNGVDSASVFANASTRFADGFRYGLGAELGISTNRTHARGPVGVEGLLSYKFKIRGEGQIVADYVGSDARPFTHRELDSE